jgi:hypothetical protein
MHQTMLVQDYGPYLADRASSVLRTMKMLHNCLASECL